MLDGINSLLQLYPRPWDNCLAAKIYRYLHSLTKQLSPPLSTYHYDTNTLESHLPDAWSRFPTEKFPFELHPCRMSSLLLSTRLPLCLKYDRSNSENVKPIAKMIYLGLAGLFYT